MPFSYLACCLVNSWMSFFYLSFWPWHSNAHYNVIHAFTWKWFMPASQYFTWLLVNMWMCTHECVFSGFDLFDLELVTWLLQLVSRPLLGNGACQLLNILHGDCLIQALVCWMCFSWFEILIFTALCYSYLVPLSMPHILLRFNLF